MLSTGLKSEMIKCYFEIKKWAIVLLLVALPTLAMAWDDNFHDGWNYDKTLERIMRLSNTGPSKIIAEGRCEIVHWTMVGDTRFKTCRVHLGDLDSQPEFSGIPKLWEPAMATFLFKCRDGKGGCVDENGERSSFFVFTARETDVLYSVAHLINLCRR